MLTAYEFGKKAFQEGATSSPVLDRDFVATLSALSDENIKSLQDWRRGWDDARDNDVEIVTSNNNLEDMVFKCPSCGAFWEDEKSILTCPCLGVME